MHLPVEVKQGVYRTAGDDMSSGVWGVGHPPAQG